MPFFYSTLVLNGLAVADTTGPDYRGFLELLRPLDDDAKTVFTLKYLYEYTNAEIAEMTGISERRLKEDIRQGKELINEQI